MRSFWFFIICICEVLYVTGQNINAKERLTPIKPMSQSQYLSKINKTPYIYPQINNGVKDPQVNSKGDNTATTVGDKAGKPIETKIPSKAITKEALRNIAKASKIAIVHAKDLYNDTKLQEVEIKMRADQKEHKPKINKIKMKLTQGDGKNLNEKIWDVDSDKTVETEYGSVEMDNIEQELEKRVQASEVLGQAPNIDKENDRFQEAKTKGLKIENENLKKEYDILKKQYEEEQRSTLKVPLQKQQAKTSTKIPQKNINVDDYYDDIQEKTTPKPQPKKVHKNPTTKTPKKPLYNPNVPSNEIDNYFDVSKAEAEINDLPIMKVLEKVKLTSSGDIEEDNENIALRTHDDEDDRGDELAFSIDGVDLRESWI